MKRTAKVNPFYGCEASKMDGKKGLAETWFFPKAQTGNLHPGACLPLSALSVCAYSGAYPTGYGVNQINSHARPGRLHEHPVASGFAHFQVSGTGAIQNYYNYFHISPVLETIAGHRDYRPLQNEKASPGYYSATLGENGPIGEVTVSSWGARHRYRFPGEGERFLVVDLLRGGLDPAIRGKGAQINASACEIQCNGDREASGSITAAGLTIYFSLKASSGNAAIQADGQKVDDGTFANEQLDGKEECLLILSRVEKQTELCIGFSFHSETQAQTARTELEKSTFEQTRATAEQVWEDTLSLIQVSGTAEEEQLFYTNLYHALKKPCAISAHNSPEGEDYWVDFATLWDQYKTQLPLVQTLFPQLGASICRALTLLGEKYGATPIGHLMQGFAGQRDIFRNQARCLAHPILFDGFLRNVPNVDWKRVLVVMKEEILRQPADILSGTYERPTHVLDASIGACCVQAMAEKMGDAESARQMEPYTQLWRKVYDPATGLLTETGNYYEGTLWNYSFRLAPWIRERLDVFGSDDKALATLDHFFGFSRGPCTQIVDPADHETMAAGFAEHSFEGLNNEPDMETPFIYHELGRPDRCNEVLDCALRQQFQLTRTGLPGNDDSGGLTSWYVWNALGIFPATGQDKFYVGRPLFAKARIQMGGNSLTIKATPISPEAKQIQSIFLDGKEMDRLWLTWEELQNAELQINLG